MSHPAIEITGLWLRRQGDHAVVCVEIDGKWVECCDEHIDGPFSHIVEPAGIEGRIGRPHKHLGAVR